MNSVRWKGHASVLNVLGVAGFCVSCAPGFAFLCPLFGLGDHPTVWFLRLDPKTDVGNVQLFGVLVLSCLFAWTEGFLFWVVDGTSVRKWCITLLACLANDLAPVWIAILSKFEGQLFACCCICVSFTM